MKGIQGVVIPSLPLGIILVDIVTCRAWRHWLLGDPAVSQRFTMYFTVLGLYKRR